MKPAAILATLAAVTSRHFALAGPRGQKDQLLMEQTVNQGSLVMAELCFQGDDRLVFCAWFQDLGTEVSKCLVFAPTITIKPRSAQVYEPYTCYLFPNPGCSGNDYVQVLGGSENATRLLEEHVAMRCDKKMS